MKKIIGTLSIISVAPFMAVAHPGHGGHEGGYTIIHYFIEPVHSIVTISVTVAAYLLYKQYKKTRKGIE